MGISQCLEQMLSDICRVPYKHNKTESYWVWLSECIWMHLVWSWVVLWTWLYCISSTQFNSRTHPLQVRNFKASNGAESRLCVGQHFANTEKKVLGASIIIPKTETKIGNPKQTCRVFFFFFRSQYRSREEPESLWESSWGHMATTYYASYWNIKKPVVYSLYINIVLNSLSSLSYPKCLTLGWMHPYLWFRHTKVL